MSRDRHEFEEALSEFISSFELVFDNDWDLTQSRITDSNYVSPDGTFLHPKVNDESNNWGNRGALLSSYRRLREVMQEYNFDADL